MNIAIALPHMVEVVWRRVAGKQGAQLRSGPGLDTAKVGLVPRGARVCVAESVTLPESAKVRCRLTHPTAGWCSEKLLGAPLAPPAPPPPLPADAAAIAALFPSVPRERRVATETAVDDALAASYKPGVAYVQSYPARDVDDFVARRRSGEIAPDARVVVCVGDSITHGDPCCSPDWVAALQRRHPDVAFVNAGVGGDLAHNVRARVRGVAARVGSVDAFTLLVGTNDARFRGGAAGACSDPMTNSYYAAQKKVPFAWKRDPGLGGAGFPSNDRYLADVAAIVAEMAEASPNAPILLLSVPPLGDKVVFGAGAEAHDDDAEAAHVDGEIRSMNAGLNALAAKTPRAEYLPFYERCADRLAALPGAKTPYSARWSNAIVADANKGRAVHGRTYDAIGAGLGLYGCCDMIHPTEQAAALALALVEGALPDLLPVATRPV